MTAHPAAAAAIIAFLAASAVAADWYVAKDGDDAKSGATRAEAKATLEAGYACLAGDPEATAGDRLVVGDGEWEITETIVLSNGWTLAGENGRGATSIVPAKNLRVFALDNAQVRGITVDFKGVAYDMARGGALAQNPVGVFADCVFTNFCGNKTVNLSMLDVTDSTADVQFTNCLFTQCSVAHRYAMFWLNCDPAGGRASFTDCSFVDCDGYNSRTQTSSYKNFNYGLFYNYGSRTLIRNCLFLRCSAYGRYSATSAQYASIVACRDRSGVQATLENCSFVDCRILSDGNGTCLGGVVGSYNLGTTAGGKVHASAVNCLEFGTKRYDKDGALVSDPGTAGFVGGVGFDHCAGDVALDGDGNVVLTDGNFRFGNPGRGDYSVRTGPALDAGRTLDWMAGARDLAGNPRIAGSGVDIGCFESIIGRATRILVR